MNILITGFVPFGNNEINPSELVLKELAKDYNTILLPVSYDLAPKELNKAIAKYQPDVILCLGLVDKRTKISLELVGINYIASNSPDNDNVLILGRKIDNNLDDGIITNIDINKLLKELKKHNIDAYMSSTAGTYVCNLVYYTALNYTKNSLFIHLPNLDNSSLDNDIKAIKLIIENIKAAK